MVTLLVWWNYWDRTCEVSGQLSCAEVVGLHRTAGSCQRM
jgi:hypothetical protein